MKVEEIKKAVDEGKSVKWRQDDRTVVKKDGVYYIRNESGGEICLLTTNNNYRSWDLTGREEDYYIKD